VIATTRVTAPMIYLPVFEGPLELLLDVVERRRLPITDVSLAAVADQYLGQVRVLESGDPESLADFLVIAARLLLIKSRALLPAAPGTPAEEESSEELVRRLETYRLFKGLAAELARRDEAGLVAHARGAAPDGMVAAREPVLGPIDAEVLARLVAEVGSCLSREVAASPPVAPRVSVADRIATLRSRLLAEHEADWTAVAGETVDEIVATLLALLELVRRGQLGVDQDGLFGPIRLRLLEHSAVAEGGGAGRGEPQLP
jgi:segregation and condensation protein A